jgi:hypothetical protein
MKSEILAKATAELNEEIIQDLQSEEGVLDELTSKCEPSGIRGGSSPNNEGSTEEVQS